MSLVRRSTQDQGYELTSEDSCYSLFGSPVMFYHQSTPQAGQMRNSIFRLLPLPVLFPSKPKVNPIPSAPQPD